MSRASRSSVARRWKQGGLRQMGATIAFGMGAGERRHLLAPATPPLRAAASPGASAPQTQPTTPLPTPRAAFTPTGTDVPDIHSMIMWRAGKDSGELLNMIGRASRDGAEARIVIFASPSCMRRPRAAPPAPTEAQRRRAHHAQLWLHAVLAELASGRGAWPVFRALFGEAPAARLHMLGRALAPVDDPALVRRARLLLCELLHAHAAAEHDADDPACPTPPPRGSLALAAEAAVAHVGPRSGEAQQWIHEREQRLGAALLRRTRPQRHHTHMTHPHARGTGFPTAPASPHHQLGTCFSTLVRRDRQQVRSASARPRRACCTCRATD